MTADDVLVAVMRVLCPRVAVTSATVCRQLENVSLLHSTICLLCISHIHIMCMSDSQPVVSVIIGIDNCCSNLSWYVHFCNCWVFVVITFHCYRTILYKHSLAVKILSICLLDACFVSDKTNESTADSDSDTIWNVSPSSFLISTVICGNEWISKFI